MIAVQGDPLENIDLLRQISGVIKQGELVHQAGAR